ncbi:hypothetical protein M0804_010347 [Polistes exclamans]|nr:hypothetical protein M0804_010347 [Polistes exclamans]
MDGKEDRVDDSPSPPPQKKNKGKKETRLEEESGEVVEGVAFRCRHHPTPLFEEIKRSELRKGNNREIGHYKELEFYFDQIGRFFGEEVLIKGTKRPI